MKLHEMDGLKLDKPKLDELELDRLELDELEPGEPELDEPDEMEEWDYSDPEGMQPVETGVSKGKPSRRSIGPVILIVLGCVALILLIVYIAMAISMRDDSKETVSDDVKVVYTQEELDTLVTAARQAARAEAIEAAKAEEAQRILDGIRQNLTDGQATARALRPFYPDEVVVNIGGRIRFFPIQAHIRKNQFQADNLVKLENGELQYTQDGQVISHKGIDVSNHQGQIDWQKVAGDGVEFAFLRVAYRGYGTGKIVVDGQFENNVKGALANGIKVGAYFYSQSVNQKEALEEAEVVLEQIAPYRITGPVVYDAEKVENSRTSNLSAAERTDMAIAFCEKVKEAGYRPMIYLNLDTAFSMLELDRLEAYDKWFAHYGTDMYYPYDYKIWQYSDSGSVAGIGTKVDLNISFEEWE